MTSSYKAETSVFKGTGFAPSAPAFSTEVEAQAYAEHLADKHRWVADYRTSESTQQPTHQWFGGNVVRLALACAAALGFAGCGEYSTQSSEPDSAVIEPSVNGAYVVTPRGTRIYKYLDDTGKLCFLAERWDAVAIDCL